jgi:hypothetical protein
VACISRFGHFRRFCGGVSLSRRTPEFASASLRSQNRTSRVRSEAGNDVCDWSTLRERDAISVSPKCSIPLLWSMNNQFFLVLLVSREGAIRRAIGTDGIGMGTRDGGARVCPVLCCRDALLFRDLPEVVVPYTVFSSPKVSCDRIFLFHSFRRLGGQKYLTKACRMLLPFE